MTHDTFREMLPLYVIGALDGDELYNFERYIAENRERCRAEIAEYQAIADQMALAAPSARPSPAVYDRILTAIEEKKRPVETPASAPVAAPTRVPVRVPAPVPTAAPVSAPAAERRESEGFNLGLLILRGIPWAAAAVLAVLLISANSQLREMTRLRQAMTEDYNKLLTKYDEQHGGITNLTTRLQAQAQQFQEQLVKLRVENVEQQQSLNTLRAANAELDAEKTQLQHAADRMREQLEQQNLQTASLLKKVNEQTASLEIFTDPAVRIAPLADPKGQAKATAKVYWQNEKKTGLMVVSNLIPVVEGQGKCLELWAICGSAPPVPAGIGWTDESGHGNLQVKLVKDIACIDKFAVTVENAGGVPAPEGSIILIGQ
ncbi:MAG TPA: anti-sigma factor [Verrucomicrobiae bacterium]|nr:anti-sigma factor [Verrucomicrobiae bacterium]